MRKRKRHNRLVLAAALTVALLPHALLITWFIGGWIYESGKTTYETVNEPIDSFSLDVAALDRHFRAAYPEECRDMALTCARLDVCVQGTEIVNGTMSLEYYRYLNDRREGGNVATVTFVIDPAARSLKELQRYSGTGKRCWALESAILEQIVDFPLVWYVENLPALWPVADGGPLRLLCESSEWGVTTKVFDPAEDNLRVYAERATDWSADMGFAGRIYELLPSFGG